MQKITLYQLNESSNNKLRVDACFDKVHAFMITKSIKYKHENSFLFYH